MCPRKPHVRPRCDIIQDVRAINDLAMKATPARTGARVGKT